MSVEMQFGHHFKPEIKSSGRKLVAEEKVSLTSGSDTTIQAMVRASPPARVTLLADSVASPSFSAECSCPIAKKSRFCKHIWATLTLAQARYPDFFAAKTDMDKGESAPNAHEEKQKSYQETAKQRASEYRKAQYQRQKAQVKERKGGKPAAAKSFSANAYSADEESAMAYFSQNGFPMESGPSKEVLIEAKRKLSRLFHPDRGGSHEESVELNKNCDILQHFFQD